MATNEDPIVLFGGGSDGFGDAINVGRDSYPWSINMDSRALGRTVPSVAPTGLGVTAGDIPREITAVVEWETPTGRPILLLAGGRISGGSVFRAVGKVEDEAFTIEDFQSGVPYVTGVLFRDAGATEMAYFANGDGENGMRTRTKAGGYADGTAEADVLSVVGSDIWRALGYRISNIVRDTDPAASVSWNFGIPTGRPTYPINTIMELGGSPMPMKGDGVFKYNPARSDATFGNLTAFVSPHKDNGKSSFMDGRGRIYYLTVDGDIIVMSFGSQSQQRPTRMMAIDRDTPFGRIGAMAADANHVYAAIDPGGVRTQQLGLTVKTFDSSKSSFTDHTSAVT